jgi:hypothetical protein
MKNELEQSFNKVNILLSSNSHNQNKNENKKDITPADI